MIYSRRSFAAPLALAAACSALALIAPSVRADDTLEVDDQKIITEERDHSEVMANLEYLSDMVGPRLTGSDRLLQANRWTEAKMKEYKLANVHLEPYTIPRGWI